jgi:predicted lipid-binding transport protein (Tim44 family)
MLRKRLLLALAAAVLVVTAAPADAWNRPSDRPSAINAIGEAPSPAGFALVPVALPVVPLEAVAGPTGRPTPVAADTVFRRPGLLNGIASGFLNAGVIGLILGYGFFDEPGGVASLVGLFLQFGLIFVVVRLSLLWWQRRTAPETAGLTPRQLADEYVRPLPSRTRESHDTLAALGALAPITASDLSTFERLLGDLKRAYGSKDLSTLRAHVTTDLFDVLATALSRDESGDLESVSDVRLLDSKLIGQWRERAADHVRLAMHFSLAEHVREHVSDNNAVATETRTVEATEVWTFMRPADGDWRVSAIQ